jgi:transcriptional regulator with XRE-family HTH domain
VREHSRFIKLVKDALEKERYSARELALKIGVAPSYITRVLGGERNPPSSEIIEDISKVLNINPDRLLMEAGRLPVFLRSTGALTDDDLAALRKSYERIRQRHEHESKSKTAIE